MKISVKTMLLLLATAALSVTACKKDEESNADKLTAATCWQQTYSETLDPITNTWEADVIDACDRDDCINFKSDGTLTVDEGATKCDPADPQTSTGTWTISTDGNTLTITEDGGAGSAVFTIIELSSTKMIVEIDFFGFKNRTTFESN
ncbi:MAG: hypothetical protein EP344_04960 [Bacteroidetes bacterium]|nr:MAG: hypothetical protein EP344_04960 [Bacteroidota bacterium]